MRVTELTINRSTWRRGGSSDELNERFGETRLLNSKGLRCCLGFLGKACGIPDEDLYWVRPSTEAQIYHMKTKERPRWPKEIVNDGGVDSGLCCSMIFTNDDEGISDEEREKRLTRNFSSMGITVRFED